MLDIYPEYENLPYKLYWEWSAESPVELYSEKIDTNPICLQFVFKQPQYVTECSERHIHIIQETVCFIYPPHNISSTERSSTYMCIKLYSFLSGPIKKNENFKKFRKVIHNLYILHELYTVLDFLAEIAHTYLMISE